jgi:hypothetical protein
MPVCDQDAPQSCTGCLVNDSWNDQSGSCIATLLGSPDNRAGARARQYLAVIDMTELSESLVVFVLIVALVLITRPVGRRALGRLGRGVRGWATSHFERAEERDSDEDQLWLMERRRKLCADLQRVEHLLATDAWMSATRQRGNRIAYLRLVDDLRHTPDVPPTILGTFGSWDESTIEPSSRWLTNDGISQRPRTVEVLDIGRPRRRT